MSAFFATEVLRKLGHKYLSGWVPRLDHHSVQLQTDCELCRVKFGLISFPYRVELVGIEIHKGYLVTTGIGDFTPSGEFTSYSPETKAWFICERLKVFA